MHICCDMGRLLLVGADEPHDMYEKRLCDALTGALNTACRLAQDGMTPWRAMHGRHPFSLLSDI